MMLCQPYSETCNCRKPLVNIKKKALVTITLQYPSAALEPGLSLKPLSKTWTVSKTWQVHKQTQEGSTEEVTMDAFQDDVSKTLLQCNVYTEYLHGANSTWAVWKRSYFSDRLGAMVIDIC